MNEGSVSGEGEQPGVRIYYEYLKGKRNLIAAITFGTALLALIIGFLLSPIYRAETKILAPQQGNSSIASSLLGQVASLPNIIAGPLAPKVPNELYIGMIKSRTVYDKIVDRFDLRNVYKVKYQEDARNRLEKAISAKSGKDGIIVITVEDKDPERAADMANALVDELKILNKGLAVTEAAQRRLFFEEQLKDIKVAMAKAEEGMKGFQEKTGMMKVEEQAKAVIMGIATIRAQISAKEVQYKVMKSYATSQNPDLQRIEDEIKGLKEELSRLESRGNSGHDPLSPTGRIPSVSMEYMRKYRDLKYNETLYELLAKQFELAKLDEAKDAALIQVIDRAVIPEKKVWPKKAQIVLSATFIAFTFSILSLALTKYVRENL